MIRVPASHVSGYPRPRKSSRLTRHFGATALLVMTVTTTQNAGHVDLRAATFFAGFVEQRIDK
jgi:hypothetical protein